MNRRFSDTDFAVPRLPLEGPEASIELIQGSGSGDVRGGDSLAPDAIVRSSLSGTAAVFTPEGYEPNYAYPLVVWFHDAGEDERVLRRIMPTVSERNAIGLALRGERSLRGGGFDWPVIDPHRRASMLFDRVRDLRREYHVHTERVVLAGRGTGAAAAAGLFFARPEWFGGLALLDLPPESLPVHLVSSDELAGKPVLLDLPVEQLGRVRDGASRFAAAGLDVTFRHARSSGVCRSTLLHLNRWLMATICGVPV